MAGFEDSPQAARRMLREGQVIPALPLALDLDRAWSERHQRALLRYYLEAGAGGVAVAVHSTQFAIREPRHGLFRPLLELAAETMDRPENLPAGRVLKIAGICGPTAQAVSEASIARGFGYDAGLLSLSAFPKAGNRELLQHCQDVAKTLPIIGFYLQPSVGGRVLDRAFWSGFCEIEEAWAVKIAPFNRYQTLDVVRAVVESGRDDIALYTGNDDSIILDLLTPWSFGHRTRFMDGGLLGQFGVWTCQAVDLLARLKSIRTRPQIPQEWIARNVELTDANAAIFDAAHGFAGCIPGIHEVLRRQGLLPSNLCLDPAETLSPGQAEEISRVARNYLWLNDDRFVQEHLDRWLA